MEINDKYITLVFRNESEEEKQAVRDMAVMESCRAWSRCHTLNRLSLIEDAVEKGDLERAEKYISAVDIEQYMSDLD